MKSIIKTFRLKKAELEEFELLKARLKLNKLHGEDSITIRASIRLAHKHLDLKEKIEEIFNL